MRLKSLGADLIVHFGHAKMVKHESIPTIYVEARATVNVDEAVGKSLSLLKDYTTVGLATSVQHLQALNQAREILRLSREKM